MDEALKQIQELIEQGNYEFTEHALDRMAEDELDEEEVLSTIENGFITKKQKDKKKQAKWIYTILGEADTRRWLYVAGKIVEGQFQIFRILSAKKEGANEEEHLF